MAASIPSSRVSALLRVVHAIFHVSCDEPWDLGKGKNKKLAEEIGVGNLFVRFVRLICEHVKSLGKTPMMFGDMMARHPEIIDELPDDIIVHNYDSEKQSSALFQKAGVKYYVSSQLMVHNNWIPDLRASTSSIFQFIKEGREHGAAGYLGNEWGDAGHINFHTNAIHSMVLGGALAWNADSYTEEDITAYDQALSILEYGDKSAEVVALLHEMSKQHLINWHATYFWIDITIPQEWREPKTGIADSLVNVPDTQKVHEALEKMSQLRQRLQQIAREARPADSLLYPEMLLSARGASLMLEISLLAKRAAGLETPENGLTYYKTADKLRRFDVDFSKLWYQRNRPPEYYRISMALTKIATLLDGLGAKKL